MVQGEAARHMSGQEPYELHEAADHLERMASNTVERIEPMPLGMFFGAGPAVGWGAVAQIPIGVDYNPESRPDLAIQDSPYRFLKIFHP